MTGPEMNEGIEEKNKTQKWWVSVSTFLSQFSRDYVSKRPSVIKNQLIDEVMTQDNLSGTLAAKWLAEFRASDEKYNDVEIDESKIDIYMLRKYVAKSYLLQDKAQERFQIHILEQYDIDASQFESKLSSEAKKLWESDIERMLSWEYEMQKFLKKYLWEKNVHSRWRLNMFQWVDERQIQHRFKKITNSQERTQLVVIFEKLQKWQTPRNDEIKHIIASEILDETQKALFVHTFIPFITLQQAKNVWLVDESEAKKIHKNYILELLWWSDLSSDNQDVIKEQILFSDISLSTIDLAKNDAGIVAVSEWVWFQNYINTLQSHNNETLEKIRLNGPQTFEQMIVAIGEINQGNKYQNLQVFSPWSIIKFSKSDSSGDLEVDYVEIIDFDDEKREFRFKNVWNETISLKNPGEAQSFQYQDFVEWLKTDRATSFEVISKDVIKDRIQKWDIKSSSLTILEESNLSGTENMQRRQKIKDKHIGELEKEISNLQNKYSKSEDSQKKEIQRDIDKTKQELNDFRDNLDISAEQATELYNMQELISNLDEIDPKWAGLWLWKWVSFRVWSKMLEWDFWTYTIRNIDTEAWTISFYSESGVEKDINLTTFLEIFKEKKATRHKSYSSPEELISDNEVFKDHEYKNWNIIAKNAEGWDGKREDRPVEYLGSNKWKTIVKIISISGWVADIQIGEREHAELSDKEKKRGDKKDNLKIKGAETLQWTLDELSRFIEQENLKPDWKIGQTMTIVPLEHQNKFHWSFSDRLLSNFSISDIIHGWKTVIEWITESLNQWSHVKAAHAALAMWKFLPWELREDLLSKVEAAESEEMDKALKQLGAVDSWIAVERIQRWLSNRNTPESKKEAGLLFMLEKYWHLTAKGALSKFRGKFLWYEAFWGRIGDLLYNQIKEEAENADPEQTFSEEYLMHNFLKKQCGGHGFNGIHRRSRLHKEFENKWKGGINDEIEKWYKDASNYRDIDKIVREGIWEMKWGTTSNAVWWAKRAGELGGSLEQMNQIPFVLLFSGACYNIDQATYKHIKWCWDGEWQPIVLFRMFWDKAKMNMFDDVMQQLIPDIEKAYPHLSDIAKKAQDVKNGKDEVKRIELANKFWEKYGGAISWALTMSLRSDGTYSATDNILQTKRAENNTYNTYYDFIREATNEGNAMKDEFIKDWAGPEWAAGINLYTSAKKHMATHSWWGFRDPESAKIIWDGLVDKVNAIPNRVVLPGAKIDDIENRNAQKQIIASMLQDVIWAFYEGSQFNEKYISGFNKPTSDTGAALNSWNFNLSRDLWEVSWREIAEWKHKIKFERAAEKIISGSSWSTHNTPDILVKKTKDAAGRSMWSQSDNYKR